MGGSFDWRMLESGRTSANTASTDLPPSKAATPTGPSQQYTVTSTSGWTVHVVVPACASATLYRAADLACATIQMTVDQLGAGKPADVPDIDALLNNSGLYDAVNSSVMVTDYNGHLDTLTRAKSTLTQNHKTMAENVQANRTDQIELDRAICQNTTLLAQRFAAAGTGKPSATTESFLLKDIVSTLQDVESEFEAMAYQNTATADNISLLSLKQLEAIMPGTDPALLEEYLPYLEDAMRHAEINTPRREAAFLAEVAEETDHLRTLTEYGSQSYFDKYYGPQSRVGRELGNSRPGDGARFKGRGGLQLTGRHNYEAAGRDLGIDELVDHPELAADPKYAFTTAAWYWNSHHLNGPADTKNFPAISETINGGSNGSAARDADYALAQKVLGVE